MGMSSNIELGKKYYICHACHKGVMERDDRRYCCLVCGTVVHLYSYTSYRPNFCKECHSQNIAVRFTGKDFESYECASCGTMIVTNMTHRI